MNLKSPKIYDHNLSGTMMSKKLAWVMTLALTVIIGPLLVAQVTTEVPPVIPGAKPVTVEHIKIDISLI